MGILVSSATVMNFTFSVPPELEVLLLDFTTSCHTLLKGPVEYLKCLFKWVILTVMGMFATLVVVVVSQAYTDQKLSYCML